MTASEQPVFLEQPDPRNYPNCDDWNLANQKYQAGIDVSNSFDRSKTYVRVLRRDDPKYRPGLCGADNTAANDCHNPPVFDFDKPSGFYFCDLESVFCFAFGWGVQLCRVTVPAGARIARIPPPCFCPQEAVWRADSIILSEPVQITPALIDELVARGARTCAKVLDECMTRLGAEYDRQENQFVSVSDPKFRPHAYQSQTLTAPECQVLIDCLNRYYQPE